MQKQKSVYNLTEEQRAELDGKLRELLALCQIYHIPMFASCAVASNNEETEYLNIIYSAQSHSMLLHDDRIRQYMLIANGSHEAVLKRENLMFDPFGVLKDG